MKKFAIKISEELAERLHGKVGVDAGATLSKIVFENKGELICIVFPTNLESILNFLKNVQTFQINLTGGRAFMIYKKICQGKNCNLIDEFEAGYKGIEILFELNKKKPPKTALFASVGTGTSISFVDLSSDGGDNERLGGTALGGGVFLGLVKLLYDIEGFDEAIKLSKTGNPYNVDLKVSDIYDEEDDRIDLLFRQFTAASLGKIAKFQNIEYQREDVINSIVSFISENISHQLILNAKNSNVKDIILTGGFLIDNTIFKQVVSIMCKMSGLKTYFLKNNELVGALGALNF